MYIMSTTTIYVSLTGNDTTGNGTIGNPYATIVKALTVAVNGDVIQVAPGTYNEAIVLTKSLTLLGVNMDKTATEVRDATLQTKIVGGFTLNTSNITINGFEIVSNSSNSYPIIGNIIENNNNNITIKSNYIHDIKSKQGIYRAVTQNYVSNWLIDNNYISDFMSNTTNTTAVYPNGIDGLTVSNNIIKHYTNGASRRGLNIDACSVINITNNTIDMNKDTYDDIYAVQLFWSYQKTGNIGPINIQNNNLIGAYYGIVFVSARTSNTVAIQNTIDGITISNNMLDTIDWLGIQTGANYYNYNFVMKNVSINDNIFKNMAFTSISVGPDYYTNYGEYGVFNANNAPFQNYRIYNNSYFDSSNQPVEGLINLYSTSSTSSNPTIVNSNSPTNVTNLNGIILDDVFKYLNRATIDGSSGDVGPIPNPIRIITNSDSNYVFDVYYDYFKYVVNFTGISNIFITNLLTNVSIISGNNSNLQTILDYIIADNNPLNITMNLDTGTYTQSTDLLNETSELMHLYTLGGSSTIIFI